MRDVTGNRLIIKKLSIDNDELVIEWHDGKESRLYSHWLRDHCQMPTSRNADNGQRLIQCSQHTRRNYIEKVIRMKKAMSVSASNQKIICLFFHRAG